MKKLTIIFSLFLLAACGSKEKTVDEKPVELKTSKDKLSYALGSMSAQSLVGSKDENLKKLDMQAIIDGFRMNLKDDEPKDCQETIQKLFGPDFRDFDTMYRKTGSECIGRLQAYSLYSNLKRTASLDEFDMDMITAGFRYAMMEKDTLMTEKERTEIVQNFIMGINVKNGDKMMVDAKNIAGAQVFDNGIVMVTLEEGKGGSPSPTDDVKVEYILKSANGDVIQSSYDMKAQSGNPDPMALSLDGGVIKAWSFALPKMKKGGKYQIYVPYDMAYGEQGGKESLNFVIELVDFAPKGKFVTPQPQQMPGGF